MLITLTTSLYSQSKAVFDILQETGDIELDRIARYSQNLHTMKRTQTELNRLRIALETVNKRDINELKQYLHREKIAVVFIYATYHFEKNLTKDAIIELLEKSTALSKEPNTIYKLTLLYKEKYEMAIEEDNIEDRMFYGYKIYENLVIYTDLLQVKRASFKNC